MNPRGYGRTLFDAAFGGSDLAATLSALPANSRLLLVIADSGVAGIGWEYLRLPPADPDDADDPGALLAGRVHLVRAAYHLHARDLRGANLPLQIVAIAPDPSDGNVRLMVEDEWQGVRRAVDQAGRALTLTRVRPPSLDAASRALQANAHKIVHFMGHSSSHNGRAVLEFEDGYGQGRGHRAEALAAELDDRVLLVLLNSCLSADAGQGWTDFGDIARGLVNQGVAYALGMAAAIPDAAARKLSAALYDHLLNGRSVEEAVRRARLELGRSPDLRNPDWLAGLPVLYTSCAEPLPGLVLAPGRPQVQPSPQTARWEMAAINRTPHFTGRSEQMAAVLRGLQEPTTNQFVVIHGLGGMGKTALAREAAERAAWLTQDRGLALSFEAFGRNQRAAQDAGAVAETDRFFPDLLNRLARFYGLDPAHYPRDADLQTAITQARTQIPALLYLDNLETVLDALKRDDPEARRLAHFLSTLPQGQGALLVTSRILPPAAWGNFAVIDLEGMALDHGAQLFLALLDTDSDRSLAGRAPFEDARRLSQRVDGHPLAIRLLAGQFAQSDGTLAAFLEEIESALHRAEQETPTSLEDPQRQATLYACMAYSVDRLDPNQIDLLRAVSLFRTPFLSEFVAGSEGRRVGGQGQAKMDTHYALLISLRRLGLLSEVHDPAQHNFATGKLARLALHPMLRWYVQAKLPPPSDEMRLRHGLAYLALAQEAWQPQGYDSDARIRTLVQQSLPDLDAALAHLPPAQQSNLAYHLEKPYRRLGQPKRALDLLTQSLRTKEELGEVREIAVTQNAMAALLVQMGRPQEAMALYQQSLRTSEELGEVRSIAVTRANFSQLLIQQGELARGVAMAWQAYTTLAQHGYRADAQTMQGLLGQIKEALGSARFDAAWAAAVADPQPDWLRPIDATGGGNGGNSANQPILSAIRAFVNASDWAATRTVVETEQDLLFRPEVLEIFHQNIEQARSQNDARAVQILQTHLDLLEACREEGIAAAFARLEASDDDQRESPDLPFDLDLIPRTVAALRGSPQEKMALALHLQALKAQVDDAGARSLFAVIEMALFGGDPAQLGRELPGVYAQIWQAIQRQLAAGDVDLQLLQTLANNTLAVLGPAAAQRGDWQAQLVQLRNHLIPRGDSETVALVDALLDLLAADGDPRGLGRDLSGIHAEVWQTIVQNLPG
ncbi:MAG: CHAT domain-containing protein [Caldilineaceae bacterium]|nr:CHAT domain-containing protein [Caldilineaceae bacterium]